MEFIEVYAILFQIYVKKNLCGENLCGDKMTNMRSAKRWWMVWKLDGNENERRSSVRLQRAGKYWKVRWLESPRYLIYHEAVEIESQTKSFFILSSYFSNKVQQCCLPLGLGRIRLTSRAYDYMNMMWILRRRIIKISFIFGIYDVNILHIFSSVHILTRAGVWVLS